MPSSPCSRPVVAVVLLPLPPKSRTKIVSLTSTNIDQSKYPHLIGSLSTSHQQAFKSKIIEY
ncbi:hypothetical protein PF005_g2551 [Phytophthora fragariae]|uniref:Uncharacterized protein n=1 Tax=Phytophthora fragariae TaxID=53985 RepID=A0A6A3ZA70_9STRA|nr:hypothetical protein PF003_g1609 [Phytophthora fragariae]KAE8944844.1 hypothetical protein PF009_g5497 [Phytophthora fragariae]KAE9127901.1 hypothetical protein PF010_g4704 [Phytophthora fragariae]KAE9131729.1 hypothetical protein PF007_g4013 [Phytophthora fragariae]KAE9145445.1 hypothetical protein PF006_g9690 [Phytophthora fragariae]